MGYLKTYPKSSGLPRLVHRCTGHGAPEERVHGVGMGHCARRARKGKRRSLSDDEENMYCIVLLRAPSGCHIIRYRKKEQRRVRQRRRMKRKREKTLN